jgi:Plasma-membrane choline transporter
VIPLIIGVILAYFIVDCFITVFEMTIDTIFLSFCEDCEQNNGIDRPFYMSRQLMEVMMDLKHAAGGEFKFNRELGQNLEAGGKPTIPPNWKFSG